jgi:type I restriction enzyme M protein
VPTSATPSNFTYDLVAKIWNLFNILKDGGVTYHQYVTELTYLLFLKMAKETETQENLPEGFRWDDLINTKSAERLDFYKKLLSHLAENGSSLVKQIYFEARTSIQKPRTLSNLVDELDKLAWHSINRDGFGDLYEGLLEKNAGEKKSGAGQYFTPRPLIDCMVAVMKPTIEDVIQDPAAGTGGFLISANRYILEHNDPSKWTEKQKEKYARNTFYGMELVHETHRLALMNLMLHGLESNSGAAGIHYGDTLSPGYKSKLPPATLILSNPPFGSKKGDGEAERADFAFTTSNKQLAFLQHIYNGLLPNGRAAVIVPDNVLFESNIGKAIRAELMDKCNLHTILRLPTGIFYAQGVKTSVLFFTRGVSEKNNTHEVWVYDLRANMPAFGKRTLLAHENFTEFEKAFGNDPLGKPTSLKKRITTNEMGRFRSFSRQWIFERGDNLDISWLKDESEPISGDEFEPDALVQEALIELETAMAELRSILTELGNEVGE